MTSSAGPDRHHIEQSRLDGRYRLIERLGHGGTADVWRAHDDRLGRPVAIKILDKAKANPEYVRGEAQALAQFSHPHIASVFDCGDDDGRPFLVMELVEGRSLANVLSDHEISWPAAVACCGQVAAALAAAHGRGLVHRDVTPANIMLTPSGAKLIDFGISATEGEPEADADGGLRGTPAYVAPERLSEHLVTPRADVYSVGLVLYQSLSGRLPWRASNAREIWALRDTCPPDPLPTIEGLPAEVAEACMQCLARDPADRPDAARLAEVLNASAPAGALAELARLAVVTEERTDPTQLLASQTSTYDNRWRERRYAVRLVAVAASILSIGALGWAATDWSPVDATATPLTIAAPAPAAPAVPSCAVTFELKSDHAQRFQVTITATERAQRLPAGWQLSFRLPGSQPVDIDPAGGWRREADILTSPAQPVLNVGGSAMLTLSGRHTGTIPMPTTMHAYGQQCDVTALNSVVSTVATPATGPVDADDTQSDDRNSRNAGAVDNEVHAIGQSATGRYGAASSQRLPPGQVKKQDH
jgi:eukaryotic-like serine/threonine-protein kinase